MEAIVSHKKCPFCAELILAEAQKCRYCGEMLTSQHPENRPVAGPGPQHPVDAEAIRRGVTQAYHDYRYRNVLGFEMLLLAAIVGLAKQSWWAFGAVFIILGICLAFRALTIAVCVGFSLFWGGLAFLLASGGFSSTAAGIVIGIFVFLASYGIHDASARTMRT